MSRHVRVAVAVLLAVAAAGPAASAAPSIAPTDQTTAPTPTAEATDRSIRPPDTDPNGTTAARIVAVYPNPVADGDRGEFVVVALPSGATASAYELTDGEGTVGVGGNASGLVALSPDPSTARNLTDHPVVAPAGDLALANSGERLELRRDGRSVATARYRDAPAGELGRFGEGGTVDWRPLGRTDRPVVAAAGGTARAFVLPDAPAVPVEVLRRADERILLAGYTFASERVAQALVRASRRGVEVRILLEGGPVDGITGRQARLLDRLVAAGVDVRLLGGPLARYDYHHAKYAVADGRAVVLTENWKPSGTGGASSRGWGAVVSRPEIVRGLAETFRADAGWQDATAWTQFRRGRSFARGTTANGSYPSRFDPERVPVNRTRLFVAPDNAGQGVTAAIENATDSVDVIQMAIDTPDQRFLRATISAARRGVEVRVLLSGAWYVRDSNRRLAEFLRERADAEDLPIEAKLADPRGRYEKIHAKGVVVDGDQVLLGSLNWNDDSIRANREVVLSLRGEQVGGYYREVFEADWGEGADGAVPRLPAGIVAAVLGSLTLAVLVARRIEFGENRGVGPG